jgi:inner membrane protein YidH
MKKPSTDLDSDSSSDDDPSFELSSRRTGMAFQRTRMSADRTLMAVIRTSLALIGFGFTVFQFFHRLRDAEILHGAMAAGRFGIALVLLGIVMLVLGIGYHAFFMNALRHERKALHGLGFVHAESPFPVSLTLIVAVLLLALGLVAIVSMIFNTGPLQ